MNSPLWAPWRIDYIVGPKPDHCVFCEMTEVPVRRFRELLVLVRQPYAFVCLNKYPFAAGHLLVVPTKHVNDLAALDEAEYDALFRLVRKATAGLRKALAPGGVNIGINLGRAAGAGIAEHLHVHVVPRWNGDTNFLPIVADVRVMPEYLAQTRERLLPHFAGP